MAGKVYNRFKILLSEMERKEGRHVSFEEVSKVTGISRSSLSAWANHKVTRYDADTIAALCGYFDCEVGDLLVYEEKTNH